MLKLDIEPKRFFIPGDTTLLMHVRIVKLSAIYFKQWGTFSLTFENPNNFILKEHCIILSNLDGKDYEIAPWEFKGYIAESSKNTW